MACLSDVRAELFARNLSIGMSPIDACGAAGYKRSSSTAGALARKPHIIIRVQELIEQHHKTIDEKRREIDAKTLAAEAGINAEWVLEHLKLNAELAQDAGQFGPALQTLKTIGNYIGMMDRDGAPVRKQDDPDRIQKMPEVNLDALSEALMEKLPDGLKNYRKTSFYLDEEDEEELDELIAIEESMPDDPDTKEHVEYDDSLNRGSTAKKVSNDDD